MIDSILRELYALFVDDGSFAAAILAWIAASWLLLPRLALSPALSGLILFAGLAAILLESALRRARAP